MRKGCLFAYALTSGIQDFQEMGLTSPIFSDENINPWTELNLLILKNGIVLQLDFFNEHR